MSGAGPEGIKVDEPEQAHPPTSEERRYVRILFHADGSQPHGRCLPLCDLEPGDVFELFEHDGAVVGDGLPRRALAKPVRLPDGRISIEAQDARATPVLPEPLPGMRQVPREEMEAALRQALLVGPVRALQLLERVPMTFRKRGWASNEDLVAIACAAIACVFIGAGGQRFRIPSAARMLDKWNQLTSPAASDDIVSVLDLGRLLEP